MIDAIRDWISDWRWKRQLRREIIAEFGHMPRIGDVVCDCRYQHLPIVHVHEDDDTVTVEDEQGDRFTCSLKNCCSPVPHPDWEHDDE